MLPHGASATHIGCIFARGHTDPLGQCVGRRPPDFSVEVALLERSVVLGVEGVARDDKILKRIARALGEPEDAFLDGAEPRPELADTYEMMRIWHDLNSMADRKKLLALARTLAAERS